MRCTCSKWIEKMNTVGVIHIRGGKVVYCPFCGLQLVKDGLRIHITYDGPVDISKESRIINALSSFIVLKSPGKKKLYFDIP